MNNNYCIDCKKKISKVSTRCKSCSNKFRKGNYNLLEEVRERLKEIEFKKGRLSHNKGKTKNNYFPLKEASKKMAGNKNPMWRGDDVGYNSLHEWIKNRKLKPPFCEICQINIPLDLSNKSGKYKRDLGDWEWLCRKCHMKKDGRLKKLNKINQNRKISEEEKKRHKKEYYEKNKEWIKKRMKEYSKKYYQRRKNASL